MRSSLLRAGVVVGAAALLMAGIGVAATAISQSDGPDTVAATESPLSLDDGTMHDDAPRADGAERPDDGRGGHRAGPQTDGPLAVPPEERELRDDREGRDGTDGGLAGPPGAGGDDEAETGTGEPELVG